MITFQRLLEGLVARTEMDGTLYRPRTCGAERPYDSSQLNAILCEIVSIALTLALFVSYARPEVVVIPLVIYLVPVAIVLYSWGYCTFVDPSLPVCSSADFGRKLCALLLSQNQ